MFNLIASIFKYSLLVLTILVLSHIIEIKGVSISQHVKNAMNWTSGLSPTHEATKVSQEISSAVTSATKSVADLKNHHEEAVKAMDADITPQDQNQLNRVISTSEHHR
jgi:hypothetical protein